MAGALRKDEQFGRVICAYLEIDSPSISKAIELAVTGGFNEVRVFPYFVHTGGHVLRHIPEIVRRAAKRHGPGVKIKLCPYLGFHEKIVSVVRERLR